MFNTFFTSLFGTKKETLNEEPPNQSQNNSGDLENEYSAVKLVEINDDGIDWLLVEKQDDKKAENVSKKCVALVPWKLQESPRRKIASKVTVPLMDDSWFLTPPECFISLDERSVLLETSPFENLLIEHPSMSVYYDYKKKLAMGNEDLVIIDLNKQVLLNEIYL